MKNPMALLQKIILKMAEIFILNSLKTWPIWYSVKTVLLIWMIARYLAKRFFNLFFYNTQLYNVYVGKFSHSYF